MGSNGSMTTTIPIVHDCICDHNDNITSTTTTMVLYSAGAAEDDAASAGGASIDAECVVVEWWHLNEMSLELSQAFLFKNSTEYVIEQQCRELREGDSERLHMPSRKWRMSVALVEDIAHGVDKCSVTFSESSPLLVSNNKSNAWLLCCGLFAVNSACQRNGCRE